MTLTFRHYQTEEDFWRMREFLRQVLMLNGCRQFSWHVARLEYARWHTCLNCAKVRLEDVAFLWEEDGKLAAILMPDGGRGEAHLLVHPMLRTPGLDEEMLIVAEENLAEVKPGGKRSLCVWSPEQDTLRQELLLKHGYEKDDQPEVQWRRNLSAPIPEAPVAEGYSIRPLGEGLELLERCYASGLGFHEGDLKIAVENRDDPSWYRNIQTAPLYRRDLDLVAVSARGEIGAFCTIWFDDVTRSAYFEPVATVPAHRQKGLARAVMTEGLHRLKRMGATIAFVCGFSQRANELYRSVMGPDHDLYWAWNKEW